MDRIIYIDIVGDFTVVNCFDGEHFEPVEFYQDEFTTPEALADLKAEFARYGYISSSL